MLETFENYLIAEKRFSAHTVEAYLFDVNQFVEFSEITKLEEFREVDHQLVRAWVVNLVNTNYENKSTSRKLASLRTFFKFLLKSGVIDKNPTLKIAAPKLKKKLPTFIKDSELEVQKIDHIFSNDFEGQRDRLMFEILYQTGIRLSELIALKESNVSNKSIKVLGKRNKERIIPISDDLINSIEKFKYLKNKQLKPSVELLILNNGKKMYPKFVYRKINYYLSLITSLELKSPHVMRHTFATHMLNNGAGLETIKELLGHASLAATQVYTHNSFAQLTSIYSSAHPRGHKKS